MHKGAVGGIDNRIPILITLVIERGQEPLVVSECCGMLTKREQL